MLLKVNESAASLIDRVNDMQLILKNKLRLALSCIPKPPKPPEPPCPPEPEPPCPKPCRPCVSKFLAVTDYYWSSCTTLRLEKCYCCDNGVDISKKRCDTLVLLPAYKKFRVELDLELVNKSSRPVSIEMRIVCGDEIVCLKEYSYDAEKRYIHILDTIMETPVQRKTSKLSIRLKSQENLKICKGKMSIVEIND
jgi:hypothetical protein